MWNSSLRQVVYHWLWNGGFSFSLFFLPWPTLVLFVSTLPHITDLQQQQQQHHHCTLFKLSHSAHYEHCNLEDASPLASSPLQQPHAEDGDADEGFASSSSVEQDQIYEVIRRKRSSHQIPANQHHHHTAISDPIEKSRKLFHEKIKMAPLESILWIISFVWVFYQLFRTGAFDNQVIAGWMASILLGILWVRFSSKQKSKNEDSATSSDEQWDIHDAAHQQSKKSDGNAFQKSSLPTTHTRGLNEFPESINRIFGASKTSFR